MARRGICAARWMVGGIGYNSNRASDNAMPGAGVRVPGMFPIFFGSRPAIVFPTDFFTQEYS
jgi:hypothetical protein